MNLYFINHDSMPYICKLMTCVHMCGTFIQAASVLFIFNKMEHCSPLLPKQYMFIVVFILHKYSIIIL